MRRILGSVVFLTAAVVCSFCQDDLAALMQQAKAGDSAAQVAVATRYAFGQGLPRDLGKAQAWFQKAAAQGSADAQYRLGVIYDIGLRNQDPVAAIQWYKLAAAQGHRDAEYQLGLACASGRGVKQDGMQAAKWFQQAANRGHTQAAYQLGQMYEEGRGVGQDYALAFKYYLQAAEQQRPEAEYKVGHFYAEGLGVGLNNAQAVEWYRKAEKQGYALAHVALKQLDPW